MCNLSLKLGYFFRNSESCPPCLFSVDSLDVRCDLYFFFIPLQIFRYNKIEELCEIKLYIYSWYCVMSYKPLDTYGHLEKHSFATYEIVKWHFSKFTKLIKSRLTLKRKYTDPLFLSVFQEKSILKYFIKVFVPYGIFRQSLVSSQVRRKTRMEKSSPIHWHLYIFVHLSTILANFLDFQKEMRRKV